MIDQVVLLAFLIIFSGLFSSAETALFSISTATARHLVKDGKRTSLLIRQMKDDSHRLLTTILIGNNLVNVAASALATSMTIKLVGNYAVSLATGVMTFLILVFGEVFPKSMANRNNIMVARLTIFPIWWLSRIFYPVIWFLNFIPKITGMFKRPHTVTEEELMTFVEIVEEEGEIKEEEKELIHNIFEFDDTNASEIMTPRADMFVIDADEPLDLLQIAESGFTRIPVIEGNIDNVIGILNIKDLFLYQAKEKSTADVRSLMRPPYFVPENKKLDSLLQQFKQRKTHMAIVVDEYGGVAGLITLEDALEELVGEIRDETDREDPHIVTKSDQEWIVLGKSDIDEVNSAIGMKIPKSAEYDTFSGFVLDKIGRIPEENEKFVIDGYEIVVKTKDGNRIKEYIVRLISPDGKADSLAGQMGSSTRS